MNMTGFLLLTVSILSEGSYRVIYTDSYYYKQETDKQFIDGLRRDLFIYVSSYYSSGDATGSHDDDPDRLKVRNAVGDKCSQKREDLGNQNDIQ